MEKIDVNKIQFEPKEILLTNLLWLLGDVMQILMSDNLEALKAKRLTLRHETKYRYNQMLEVQEKARKAFLRFTKDIAELNDEQIYQYISDSELMRNFILLLSDKLIGRPDNVKKAWEYLYDLPSENAFELDRELEL